MLSLAFNSLEKLSNKNTVFKSHLKPRSYEPSNGFIYSAIKKVIRVYKLTYMEMKSEKDSLKAFIVKVYFPKSGIVVSDALKLFLSKKENKFLKALFLPDHIYCSYTLFAFDGSMKQKVSIAYKDKEALKHLLRIIEKK